jgi:hypothetical protein
MKQIFTCTAMAFCLLLSLFTHAQSSNLEPLPDDLLSFDGTIENAKVILSWQVAKNEIYTLFEVEKSSDGTAFSTNGIVFTSEKPGTETYKFKNNIADNQVAYFRLKAIDNNHAAYYSKVITVKGSSNLTKATLSLLQNPIEHNLSLNYTALTEGMHNVEVYTLSGLRVYTTKVLCNKGANTLNLQIDNIISKGNYIVNIPDGAISSTAQFIKN